MATNRTAAAREKREQKNKEKETQRLQRPLGPIGPFFCLGFEAFSLTPNFGTTAEIDNHDFVHAARLFPRLYLEWLQRSAERRETPRRTVEISPMFLFSALLCRDFRMAESESILGAADSDGVAALMCSSVGVRNCWCCAWCCLRCCSSTHLVACALSLAARRVASPRLPSSAPRAAAANHSSAHRGKFIHCIEQHNSYPFEQHRRSRSGSRIGRPAAGSGPQPRSLPFPFLRRHAASVVECRLVTLAGIESSPAAPAALFRRAVPAADLPDARHLRRARVAAPRALPAGDRRHAHALQGQNRSGHKNSTTNTITTTQREQVHVQGGEILTLRNIRVGVCVCVCVCRSQRGC